MILRQFLKFLPPPPGAEPPKHHHHLTVWELTTLQVKNMIPTVISECKSVVFEKVFSPDFRIFHYLRRKEFTLYAYRLTAGRNYRALKSKSGKRIYFLKLLEWNTLIQCAEIPLISTGLTVPNKVHYSISLLNNDLDIH